jgi:hypothetical protein
LFLRTIKQTNTNNSFYIVRSPCPLVQRILYLYLVYIRPFRSLISRSLEVLSKKSTNPHLFSTHDSATACFSPDQAHSSLKHSTAKCAVPMTTSLYRQIVVSIAKKHLPALVKPFDPNTPKDYNGFLQLLSFQTGRKPVTHASAYALEHGFPTKLQPDLIDRYLVNSHMWHEFTLTREEDVLDRSLAATYHALSRTSPVSYCPDSVTLRKPECVTPESSDVDSSDELLPIQTQEQRQRRGKKRRRETESCSPLTRKILVMQQQLHDLIHQSTSRDYRESYLETEPETSDWEDRRGLQRRSEVQSVLKKDVRRKDYRLEAHSTRTSRSNKRRRD